MITFAVLRTHTQVLWWIEKQFDNRLEFTLILNKKLKTNKIFQVALKKKKSLFPEEKKTEEDTHSSITNIIHGFLYVSAYLRRKELHLPKQNMRI